jgi:flavin-dependent dehydrogenase
MPKGYSWVFPMEKYRLKVGAGRFNIDHKIVAHTESLRYYINILIRKHVNPNHYEIVDVHGSMIKYSKGLKDIYCRDNVIAIGDAVSTVNPLGGEGIRHGMYSADVAAEHIKRYLENEITDFRAYAVQMRRHFLPKWDSSANESIKRYLVDSDRRIDNAFSYLGFLTTKEIIGVLFYYKRGGLLKGFLRYLRSRMFAVFAK